MTNEALNKTRQRRYRANQDNKIAIQFIINAAIILLV